MNKRLSIITLLLVIMNVVHAQPRYTSYRDIKDAVVTVWNENEKDKWVLVFREGRKFLYLVSHTNEGITETKNYSGTVSLRSTRDTIWLDYGKSPRPEGALDYITMEASGTYLIQPFAGNKKRIFLRGQPYKTIFRCW